MNKVILMGRLTKDVELKDFGNSSMAKFTIAVNKELSADKKREFEANNKPTADFLNVVVWGKMAENCSRMIEKGNRVLIDGRIEISKSNDTYYTNIVANSVQFIDFKSKEKENPFEEDFSNVSDERIPF